MRMWMIDPKLLCKKHLLGEHGEIHKFKHTFEKKFSVNGRVSPIVQIQPKSMQERHDVLAKEMLSRGYNHKSDYIQPDVSYIENVENIDVDLDLSIVDLCNRCSECKRRICENYV